MKKKLLLIALGSCAFMMSAQQVSVVEHHQLLKGVEGEAFFPVLNQTGDRLLFASGEQGTLKMYDFNDNVVTRISDERGTGIDATFGPDGGVYYVSQTLNEHNLIYRTGKRYDIARAESEVVLEPQHGAMTAVAGTAGAAVYGPKKAYRSKANIGTSVRTDGSKVIITVNGKERSVSPVQSHAGYLWASLSPDGKKVAFVAAETGVYVIDLDGKVLSHLGKYEFPSWYDNDYLVVQNAKDNGYQYLSSQILLLKADGTFTHELTKPTGMAMQPTSAGGRIVYSTIDGNLFEMKINIQ